MGTTRKKLEESNRLEREERPMDDMVAIGTSSTKSRVYHEVDENGDPVCVTPHSCDQEWRNRSRQKAIRWNLYPCFQPSCKENIDGRN